MRTDRKEAIIDTVKAHYDRDFRKSLVRALRDAEKTKDPEARKIEVGLDDTNGDYA
jgi:uncharacterized protein YihD (DUF1040 family)